MTQLSFKYQEDFEYYAKHINRTERFNLLRLFNFSIAGSIPNVDWELFGAILTNNQKKHGYGTDLEYYEIKSAVIGNSFEYQYHLHGGESKLNEDIQTNHIFISYASNYQDIIVRLVLGQQLATIFEGWREGLIQNYTGINPRQRYRKSISYTTITKLGLIIMQIGDGQLIHH